MPVKIRKTVYIVPGLLSALFHAGTVTLVCLFTKPVPNIPCHAVKLEIREVRAHFPEDRTIPGTQKQAPEAVVGTGSHHITGPDQTLLLHQDPLYLVSEQDKTPPDAFFHDRLIAFNRQLHDDLRIRSRNLHARSLDANSGSRIYDADRRNQMLLPLHGDQVKTRLQSRSTVFNFIPDRAQIRILDLLFRVSGATQNDVYIQSDSVFLSFREMENSLERLFESGWISREKISPEHNFMFFGIPIEMSRKNRKNPVYLYKPLISRETLIRYLQSVKQQCIDDSVGTDSTATGIRELNENLCTLVQQD
ncbi:hypothetical protein JW948_13105 [bacterium]|nr:hypothetical protein [bacterium]